MQTLYPKLAQIDELLKRGFAIIPLKPKSKEPLIKWADFQKIAPSHAQVEAWFKKCPDANVGAIMGAVSGNILVIDIDARNGGLETMKSLDLPETMTVATGGGGFHCYYRSKGAIRKQTGIMPGIDLIADGGYCVMPPSVHESGRLYVLIKDVPIAPEPEWVNDFRPESLTIQNTAGSIRTNTIPIGTRHISVVRSIRGYAESTKYSFIVLWKRAYGLVQQSVEPSELYPFTFKELFDICLWAWNDTHPGNMLSRTNAIKMLTGRARCTGDIVFGPPGEGVHSFHLKDSDISASQLRNISTTQHPNYSTSQY